MTHTFIHYVATDLLKKYGNDMSGLTVVFPNKRASLFLNKALAALSDSPVWSPSYTSISELFGKFSSLTIADDIRLICLLYRSYTKITGSSETLDEFFGWGQLLLADFDDIDKNLADSEMVLCNTRDLHEFDSVSFLTDSQKEILKSFFSNFSNEHESILRERFIKVWSRLNDVYTDFRKTLKAEGLAYEGMIYREVSENVDFNNEQSTYIFVGFNLLQKSELNVFRKLQRADRAKFYWDFDAYYNNTSSEAGRFINRHLQQFTNELDCNDSDIYDNFSREKDFTLISAPTENAQARYINQWLTEERISAGSKTAIVLCDESLLQTITHSLPPSATDVNITSGYPLSQTPITSMLNLLITLQTKGRIKNTDKYRLKHVDNILRHSYAPLLSDNATQLRNDLNSRRRFFPPIEELAIDNELSIIFDTQDNENDILQLTEWLIKITETIATRGKTAKAEDAFFQESIFRTYTLLNRLHSLIASGELTINIITFERLLKQIIQQTTIPFHGEPIKGIQVMGVLETRNLDFDHLLILSCNEGKMPKDGGDNSFIPYSIKKAFSLTTIDNRVAIYAYYFYRLLQRTRDITIVYNNSNERGRMNELSRFVQQIMVESKQHIKQEYMSSNLVSYGHDKAQIDKTSAVIDRLKQMTNLYPTDINNYQRCQKRFFYAKLAHLREPDEYEEDNIDNRMFGNIFHSAAENIYNAIKSNNGIVAKEMIEHYLKHKENIEMAVDDAFRRELFKMKTEDRIQPEYNGIQLINREVIVSYLQQMLRNDRQIAPFTIIGNEEELKQDVEFDTPIGKVSLTLAGRIDRLDMINTDTNQPLIRVIDYKTGHKEPDKIKSIEDVFDAKKVENHSDYYLQTMLYAMLVSQSKRYNPQNLPVAPALLFIQHAAKNGYNPILHFDEDPITDIRLYTKGFVEHLNNIVSDIYDPEKPYLPTSEQKRCETCPFDNICQSYQQP